MKIALGIGTINRADILHRSLEDLSENFAEMLTDFVIIDNGNQNIVIPDNLPQNIIRPAKNQGCGGSWSMIMDHFVDRPDIDHIIMPSDDVILGKRFADDLETALSQPYDVLLPEVNYHWSVVSISKHCWKTVGRFDPIFYPAYHEDWDYWYRVELAGMSLTRTPLFNPGEFTNGGSISKDRSLANHQTGSYYQRKWGGSRNGKTEKYTEPYNGDVEMQRQMHILGQRNLGRI